MHLKENLSNRLHTFILGWVVVKSFYIPVNFVLYYLFVSKHSKVKFYILLCFRLIWFQMIPIQETVLFSLLVIHVLTVSQ